MINIEKLKVGQLLKLQAQIHGELRRREVLRSENSVTCDLSDFLFCRALDLTLMGKSHKGFTAIDSQHLRYKIKGKRPIRGNKSRQLSNIRELSSGAFDFLAGVILDKNYNVEKAALIPSSIVVNQSIPNARTNSSFFCLEDYVFDIPGVEDVTAKLKSAREQLE